MLKEARIPPPEKNIHWGLHFASLDKDDVLNFEEFHSNFPYIYELFVDFCFEAFNAGIERISLQLIRDRIKWQLLCETNYKIKNVPRDIINIMARITMYNYIELQGLFKIQKLKYERVKNASKKTIKNGNFS